MKTYRIGIHFEEGVVLTVEAESEEAAQQIAMDAVHDCGINWDVIDCAADYLFPQEGTTDA